jgi:hypothetical protein
MASKHDKVANVNPISDRTPDAVRDLLRLTHRTHPQTTAAGKAMYIAITYGTKTIHQAALFMRMPQRHRFPTGLRVHPQINLIE